jgi:hypothetical protein
MDTRTKNKLIKIAYENPYLRPYLLGLLVKRAGKFEGPLNLFRARFEDEVAAESKKPESIQDPRGPSGSPLRWTIEDWNNFAEGLNPNEVDLSKRYPDWKAEDFKQLIDKVKTWLKEEKPSEIATKLANNVLDYF